MANLKESLVLYVAIFCKYGDWTNIRKFQFKLNVHMTLKTVKNECQFDGHMAGKITWQPIPNNLR